MCVSVRVCACMCPCVCVCACVCVCTCVNVEKEMCEKDGCPLDDLSKSVGGSGCAHARKVWGLYHERCWRLYLPSFRCLYLVSRALHSREGGGVTMRHLIALTRQTAATCPACLAFSIALSTMPLPLHVVTQPHSDSFSDCPRQPRGGSTRP